MGRHLFEELIDEAAEYEERKRQIREEMGKDQLWLIIDNLNEEIRQNNELNKHLMRDVRLAKIVRINEYEKALHLLLDAMDMQEKRESGEFHVTQPTAKHMWDHAKQYA